MVGGTSTTTNANNITSCSTSIDTILKYAIILNNIGVSLLEKHYYEEAMIPLKDSLSITRLLTTATIHHHGCRCCSKNNDIDSKSDQDHDQHQRHNHMHVLVDTARQMHQRAIQLVSYTSLSLSSSKRLCKVVIFDSMYLSDTSSQQLQQSDNVVEVMAAQTNPSFLSNEKMSRIPTFTLLRMDEVPDIITNCICCCTICTPEVNTCMNDKDSISPMTMMINIQSSIILHNTGLAAYCISKQKLVQISAQQQQEQQEYGWGQTQGHKQEQARKNHIVYHNAAIQSLQSSHTMYVKALQGLLSISSLSRIRTNTISSSSSNTYSSIAPSTSASTSTSTSSNVIQRTTTTATTTTTTNRSSSCSSMSICSLTTLGGLVVITKSVVTILQQEYKESKHMLVGVTTATTSVLASSSLTYYQRVLHDTQHRLTVLFKKKEQFGFISINTTAVAA